MNYVYVLWHSYELYDGREETKLLGIYSAEEVANTKIAEYRRLPGFCEYPDGFEISKYEINVDHWKEGFVTVNPGSAKGGPCQAN